MPFSRKSYWRATIQYRLWYSFACGCSCLMSWMALCKRSLTSFPVCFCRWCRESLTSCKRGSSDWGISSSFIGPSHSSAVLWMNGHIGSIMRACTLLYCRPGSDRSANVVPDRLAARRQGRPWPGKFPYAVFLHRAQIWSTTRWHPSITSGSVAVFLSVFGCSKLLLVIAQLPERHLPQIWRRLQRRVRCESLREALPLQIGDVSWLVDGRRLPRRAQGSCPGDPPLRGG